MEQKATPRVPELRIPGALYLRYLVKRASTAVERSDPYELDLADVVSRAKVIRRGGGHQARIPADADQIDRLAMWFPEKYRMDLYRAADSLREQMSAEAESWAESPLGGVEAGYDKP